MTSCQLPKECESSVYRHGCDPPIKAKAVSLSDCKRTRYCKPPTSDKLSGIDAIPDSTNTVTAIALSLSVSVSSEVLRNGKGSFFISSTITLVVPRAEKESFFSN
jgi:hypothetical protein